MESFNQSVIKHKTGLPGLAAELGNISNACRIMGFSGIPLAAVRLLVRPVELKPCLRSAAGNRI